jgi:hypothetical protein
MCGDKQVNRLFFTGLATIHGYWKIAATIQHTIQA